MGHSGSQTPSYGRLGLQKLGVKIQMKEIKVLKFGGSSVADAKSITNCINIVLKEQPAVVVVSATAQTTNLLEDL